MPFSWLAPRLHAGPYPSPAQAVAEARDLAARWPDLWLEETLGTSSGGRPVQAFRLRVPSPVNVARRPAVLVTAGIHAVEYIASYVARALMRHLTERRREDARVRALVEGADVWFVPHLNPDGMQRVWDRGGHGLLRGARVTATGVDPNRNFPCVVPRRGRGLSVASDRPWSPYFRGPAPLSEPECLALARLCARERFCAAVHFHSCGEVVFVPDLGPSAPGARRVVEAFRRSFQGAQGRRPYTFVDRTPGELAGELDLFLWQAFGTPSVTVEVGRPGRYLLRPPRAFNLFWWANTPTPWLDAGRLLEASVAGLAAMVRASGGAAGEAPFPELSGPG